VNLITVCSAFCNTDNSVAIDGLLKCSWYVLVLVILCVPTANLYNLMARDMNVFVPAAEFAIRSWPREARLVALITGNFDDSQSVGDVWTVGGYVGYANQWDYFESLWNEALHRHGVPYFHMKEMSIVGGPFAKWLPRQEHTEEVAAYFRDLVAAIRRSGLYMAASTVWLKDLDRFNRETGVWLEAFPLAAHACLSLIAQNYIEHQQPITAVFDKIEKVQSKLKTAHSYLEGKTFAFPGLCENVASTWLPGPATSRDVPGLQAADLIAWEVRKAHFGMKEWQRSRSDGHATRWDAWQDYEAFSRDKTGEDPKIRKSLGALISGDDLPGRSIVWDYMQLTAPNKARGGIWT
jgi:hypothetical protein